MALTRDKDGTVVIRFGGGLHSQAAPEAVHPRECTSGKNFALPDANTYFRPRKAIQLRATATNGQPIRGYAQLVKTDGTRSVLIQAGNTVYEWDGTSSGFTAIATVDSNAMLRGRLESNSVKDDTVYIADLAQVEPVFQWDGTTFIPLTTNLGVDFFAKHILIDKERAFFGNVKASSTTPHLLVASAQSAFGTLTTSNKPSSSLAASDAFYLPMPNLAPITGLIAAFGKLAIPTSKEEWYRLDGVSARDHSLSTLYAAASSGDPEGTAFVGNDVVFGKQGGIDILSSTERYGDVKSDDLTKWIHDETKEVKSWKLVYSPRLERVYCLPEGGGKVYVLHKALLDARNRAALFGAADEEVSPWSLWKTDNGFNFDPTCMMRLFYPPDGIEYIFMGDRLGQIWKLDADIADDDGSQSAGVATVTAERVSAPFRVEPASMYGLSGWINARKQFAGSLTLTALWGGKNVYDSDSTTVTLDAGNTGRWTSTGTPVSYWGGAFYWNTPFAGRLARKTFTLSGNSDEVQIKISTTMPDFSIEEIGIQLKPERP